MTKLIGLRAPKARFARSINVERDSGTAALEGYLPVGRAIESVDRLATALVGGGEVALSITGPYGSGKSSLALLVDALFSGSKNVTRTAADAVLEAAAPEVLESIRQARAHTGASEYGFIRCVVTSQREPVAKTVLRALLYGAERYEGPAEVAAPLVDSVKLVKKLLLDCERDAGALDSRNVRAVVSQFTAVAPVLILLDEFGKNLEAFAESPGESDLFLLQELAEWTKESIGHRLALVTLQHMAFGDYADGASGLQRREWVKIQGRFEDIPFVDTPEQTRALVAAAFEPPHPKLETHLAAWAADQVARLSTLGITDLADSTAQVASCWPLHPTSLVVLPDLCHRYGQNERTMFSFLASREPRSVARFLHDTDFDPKSSLPSVRLHQLYDYFIESAASMVGVSVDASRWIEIDTRIRDSRGLSAAGLRVLKTVGLLNLVSTGGSLRASREMVGFAAADGLPGTNDDDAVYQRLSELEESGLVTFRDFADEFRVWQGSDFDLKGAIDVARRRLRDEPTEAVMQRVLPLGPIVASRHSYESGTLRTFERTWLAEGSQAVHALTGDDRCDGLIAYVLGDSAPIALVKPTRSSKPVVFAVTGSVDALVDAAREQVAIDEVLATDDSVRIDWVVRKELSERRVAAASTVRNEFERAYGHTSVSFIWPEPVGRSNSFHWTEHESRMATVAISDVADAFYCDALPLRNDLINRHELTSQAAKARREVAEVMSSNEGQACLGIQGFGPDMTLYLSLLDRFGIHRELDGRYLLSEPRKRVGATNLWRALTREIRGATSDRLNVADLYSSLALPPYGLRGGPAPLLLLAALIVHANEFAMYEHGSFRPRLTADVCERLLRNPSNFELKCFAASSGARAQLVNQVADQLGARLEGAGRGNSVVSVIGLLVARINGLPAYARRTANVDSRSAAVRRAMTQATEPDVLLFDELPRAVGFEAIAARDVNRTIDTAAMAKQIAVAVGELTEAFPELMRWVRDRLIQHLRPDKSDVQGSLTRRSTELRDKVLDPRLKALVTALHAEMPDEESWLAYVAMQVSGVPPEGWSDDDRRRFDVAMQDLGASFLRIEALNADMRASGGGDFEALRVAVNSSSGGDFVRLLTVDPSRREALDGLIDELTERFAGDDASGADVTDWLLARLLERELHRGSAVDVGDAGYGQLDSRGEETA